MEVLHRRVLLAANYGLEQMARFEDLPYLNVDRLSAGQSSRDRTGGNFDWGKHLRVEGDGEFVILDQRGPGQVDRLWFTRGTDAVRIRMYFDGEATPRVNLRLVDLVNGVDPRFPTPLVANPATTSGGFLSYVPLPYAQSLKITVSGADDLYYNVGFQTFAAGTPVTTWTGIESASAAANQWNNVGSDPKPTAGNISAAGSTNLPANSATTLLDLNGQGARSISSIKLKIPGIEAPDAPITVTDDGRSHTGSSEFTLALPRTHLPVTLSRRLDYGIGNQKANVYVDGTLVGEWFDAGSDNIDHWRDSSIALPIGITWGKAAIRVRVEFVSSDIDWNEFRYQAIVNNAAFDTLDVGNAVSEATHGYSISQQQWTGTRTFNYPSPAASPLAREILNGTRLRITWDDQHAPAVDAPIGSFFGMGEFGAANVRSLPVGIDAADNLYVYFPMPFRTRAKIELVNDRGAALSGVAYEVQHKSFVGSFADVGYFRTQFNAHLPAQDGSDVEILDVEGAGKFLGVTQSIAGPATPNASRWYLEGDERVYLNGSNTPAIYGTGTEDFYDGAWYFEFGPFTRPLSGAPRHVVEPAGEGLYSDKTSAYRFFTHNAISFHKGIRFSIEHGAANEEAANIWTLAYYYHSGALRAVITDTLDVGSESSETAHGYTITGQTWTGTRTFTHEGDFDDVEITDDGRAHTGSSAFALAVDPANTGVILRRRLDQFIGDQAADVLVDGQRVGTWYKAGKNETHRWAEDDFLIGSTFTAGKSSIRVRIEFVSGELDFNEFRYEALSLLNGDGVAPSVVQSSFAFETGHSVEISFSEPITGGLDEQFVDVRDAGGTPLPSSAYVIESTGAAAYRVRFAQTLADGVYRITLQSEAAKDAAGNPLSANHSFEFFVLAGDVNRDRAVNFDDLLVLAQNYGRTGRTFSEGNIDYSANGSVNFDDLLLLAQRYGTSFAVSPAPARSTTRPPAVSRIEF